MQDPAEARAAMVERQLVARGIRDALVLRAMGHVPRERFVPEGLVRLAYADGPLPIGAGQTISQPYIVARMIEAARPRPGDRVLEIGAGSGYAAAVMAEMGLRVVAIERLPELAEAAGARLRALGLSVEMHVADGSAGWPWAAPFDAILVAAAVPEPPPALYDQLAPGGRLVLPVGPAEGVQRLLRLTRAPEGGRLDDLGAVRFVPLLGQAGWRG
ncbi:protein-L-isoaspartate(D-aspartate) O-methyltransferase [Limimaricola pyoseonensis]|uniref:Protein-L-isoaspartate O-methyltransferase n=1 Tax=Limimaricola pyoseonensis TaxID=521013 RepID=A0A1G7AZG2_9RHOB|nr:protein-L-isoaspartate(D-aspartate) O-methyltransferase [Limimaricola pyoseonensis]SDE19977.1 protein-L-isoaspartate(D-aspartate) O-methyltransferase [Limimaricola pyoseonensis]